MALAGMMAALVLAAAPATPPPPTPPPAAAPATPVRAIANVKGNIWRAGNGNFWSLFVVTKDGILLVDPVNPDFSAWLKGEFGKRFPGVPVRYVVYSHSHWDHIEGGAVFADTARFVGQEGMLKNMDGRFPHFPGGFIDLNKNGTVELEEVRDRPTHPEYNGVCGSNFFVGHDLNHDGHMTPPEYFSLIPKPDITYSDRMTIVLGGETIELVFPGKNHANDGTVVFLPKERVAYSVDFPADALVRASLRSLPSACGNYDSHPIAEWIKSYRTLESLDFDTLVQSHGPGPFTKADLIEVREFLEDLTAAVSAGMAAGKSLDELKKTIRLDKYKDWAFYEKLMPDNVESAYNNLTIYR
jgi:glyoxylase-like metal-dependent hydrolase (beta-lactamase superfamily II)